MAQALGRIHIQPSASPGFWQVQATLYDTVALTWRTAEVQVSNAQARDTTLLKAEMNTAFGVIDYSIGAPPTP